MKVLYLKNFSKKISLFSDLLADPDGDEAWS